MIKMTFLKEMMDEDDTAIALFEGAYLDILSLKDYAAIVNATQKEVEEDCCTECEDECFFGSDMDEFYNILFKQANECEDEDCDKDDDMINNESELCDIVSDIISEEEDLVNHPSHYTNSGMECILEMVMLYGYEETMSFCKLNAHKYRKRAFYKGGKMDIDKSDWYMNTYKELSLAYEDGITPMTYVVSKMN